MKAGDDVLTNVAFWVHAGQAHSGMESRAMQGVRKANVPPCRMGNLSEQLQEHSRKVIGGPTQFLFSRKCASTIYQ